MGIKNSGVSRSECIVLNQQRILCLYCLVKNQFYLHDKSENRSEIKWNVQAVY